VPLLGDLDMEIVAESWTPQPSRESGLTPICSILCYNTFSSVVWSAVYSFCATDARAIPHFTLTRTVARSLIRTHHVHFCVQRTPLSDHSYQVPHSHSRSADSALQIGVAMRRVSCIASVAKDPRMLKMLSASSKWKADQYGVTIYSLFGTHAWSFTSCLQLLCT